MARGGTTRGGAVVGGEVVAFLTTASALGVLGDDVPLHGS